MAERLNTSLDYNEKNKSTIALGLLALSIIGIFSLSIFFICNDYNKANTIYNYFLPLIVTWVGTIIAYYITKDNFESTNQNVRNMLKNMNPIDNLHTTKVESIMIPLSKIFRIIVKNVNEAMNLKLIDDIIKKCDENNIFRIPIFLNDTALYMIHRSLIDKYLIKKFKMEPNINFSSITLNDLFSETLTEYKDISNIFVSSFIGIKAGSSIADAKSAYDKESNCLDIFVTQSGNRHDNVLGYISYRMILEKAKLY